ncbi:MAG: rhomboid family intramembrane serine protease [Verrucomicrobiota bacterium]
MAWMPEYSSSKPLFYLGDRPISATVFLIALHVVGLLFMSLALTLGHSDWTSPLVFSSLQVLEKKYIWQWVTYAFLNTPTFAFLFDMFILYSFGKPLEESLGLKRFLAFYFALVVTGPILFTVMAPWYPVALEGALSVHFGLVIAVALLFPESEVFFFRMPLRTVTWILFALYTLQFLATRNMSELFHFWLTSAAAWIAVHLFQGEGFTWFSDLKTKLYAKKHQIKVVKETEKANKEATDLDAVLEKISRSGISSLSDREKQFLEKARQDLLKKETR